MRRMIVSSLLVMAVLAGTRMDAGAQEQQSAAGGKLEITTTSDVVKREFQQMIFEMTNLRPGVARQHALAALEADPDAGLVRVYLATAQLSPASSAAERAAESARGIAALGNASAAEILLATYVRETSSGRGAAALPILRTLGEMLPNDPFIAFGIFQSQRAGKTPEELVRMERDLLARFPDYAIGYNQFAYDLHFSGAHDEEIAAVRKYASLAPTQPNPHDTWADLLLMHGKFDDALHHAAASVRLDSTWSAGTLKIGAIELARGRANEARRSFEQAAASAPTLPARFDAQYWIAATHAVQRNAKAAINEIMLIANAAAAAPVSAATKSTPHVRMAVIEAMIGDKSKALAHLEHARAAGASVLTMLWHTAVTQASLGNFDAARAAVDTAAATPGAPVAAVHTLRAFVAVAARDLATAEAELAKTNSGDLLATAVRAEVLKAQGKSAESRALRDEVVGTVLKLNNNAPVDFTKVVARLRVEAMK